jgi:hypothetical protein
MRAFFRSSILCRVTGAVAGLWLCSGGAAWAGDGGGDFGSLTALLTNGGGTGICDVFHINPCPKVPSLTQAALEVAALGNNLSEMLLLQNGFAPASRVKANNPPAVPVVDAQDVSHPIPFPLNNSTTIPPLFVAATPGTKTTPATPASGLLSTLTPLAFISQSLGTAQTPGTAPVTQLYDTSADTFLYAVGLSSTSPSAIGSTGVPLPVPDYVYFFYDDIFRFNVSFATGTTIGKFTFPLRVLNSNGTERAVPTTLNFVATNPGDCSMSTVVGDFNGMGTSPPLTPDQVGIDCQVVLSASPASTQQHAIFEVKVPLLVTRIGLDPSTGKCFTPPPGSPAALCPDPLYFYSFLTPKDPATKKVLSNPVNSPLVTQGVYTAFEQSTGYSPPTGSTYLGTGISIGLAPSAAPLCSDLFTSGNCPATPIQPIFPLCANLPTKTTGNSIQLRPAVGAFYAMATSGETLLSAALGTASNSTCSLF